MKNILTFIIPIRHQENARDWNYLKQTLTDTITSISQQDRDGWKAVIVANHGADLPELPAGFEVKWVDFPPNPLHEQGSSSKEDFHNAIRLDKGRRILAGLLHAGEMGHAMVVDDDDFVSSRLTSFVAAHPTDNGWFIRDGYIWSGGRLLYRYTDFSRLCGTSHIVRADLYSLPPRFEAADETYIRRLLGSHIFLHDHLDAQGTPLAPLPFVGAIYRTGHSTSHTKSRGVLQQYFAHRYLLRKPLELGRRLSRLRLKTRSIQDEFFHDGSVIRQNNQPAVVYSKI